MQRIDIVAPRLADLGRKRTTGPVAFGVGCNGTVLVATCATAEPLRIERRGASFPKTQLDRPAPYDVLRIAEGSVERVALGDERLIVSYVQPHPDGALLVGARCQWRPSGADQNAVIRGWDGSIVRRMTLGDGISDVRVTPDGTIWCGYFDEGVLGSFGWGAGGAPPIGAPGIVAFDRFGRVKRTYDPVAAGTGSICDVYALNVAGDDDVWACCYEDFPIVHLDAERARSWELGIAAHALAVRGARALLAGTDGRRDTLREIVLGEADTRTRAKGTLVGQGGASLARASIIGVGDALYAFDGRRVFGTREW
ncbi:MAG: hypothetical protein M3Y87_18345 [Myxococcota bacterium]|nr:hypothetical protein [Myxococcota bacterium]